jgi:hypothetical protein|tara:strand:- start:57 stop:290 length:234 start_codon:yes stop_codon:yes gene_type:complete
MKTEMQELLILLLREYAEHTAADGNGELIGRVILAVIANLDDEAAEDNIANQAASYVKLPKYASQADRDLDELDFTH